MNLASTSFSSENSARHAAAVIKRRSPFPDCEPWKSDPYVKPVLFISEQLSTLVSQAVALTAIRSQSRVEVSRVLSVGVGR